MCPAVLSCLYGSKKQKLYPSLNTILTFIGRGGTKTLRTLAREKLQNGPLNRSQIDKGRQEELVLCKGNFGGWVGRAALSLTNRYDRSN